MRALLVDALAAVLRSCTPAVRYSSWQCYDGAAAVSQFDAPATASRVDRLARSARTSAAKPENSSSTEFRNRAGTDTARMQPGHDADPLAGPAGMIAVDPESGTK